ncbi:alpha/beta hydrolase family protein [Exilibacterium tricleocarpae]|nr:alpha/beta hydrolase [Exilibacterium tricleocarpae]
MTKAASLTRVAPDYKPVGEYMPAGWIQWPDNPDYSFQFMRILGAAQEGASAISECFLAGTRITPGDDESWYREWTAMGHVNKKRAEQAIAQHHINTARMNWLRAANYFRCAEFFLHHDDPRRLELLDLLEGCSQEYMKRMSPAGEVVKVPYENGAHLDAYFLRAPYELEKQPTVICFGGLDEFKDELLHEIPKHAFPRGMSVLLVDLPGQGATLRRQKLTVRVDTEVPVSACVDYLLSRADVDPDKIALYGASLGGYYAPRAASFEHRLKAVVSDGAIWDLQRSVNTTGYDPGRIAIRHLHWVLGIEGAGTQEGFKAIVEALGQFRLEGVQDKIQCPYLIVEGECDFAGFEFAVESYEYSKKHGLDVTFKEFTAEETGAAHCQIDNPTLGQEFICDWLADKLGIDQRQLPAPLQKPWV